MIIVHILGSAPGVGADDSCPCLGPALAVGCADDHRARVSARRLAWGADEQGTHRGAEVS